MPYKLIRLAIFLLLLALGACESSKEVLRDYAYFEKHGDTLKTLISQLKEPVIQKHDFLSIKVSSATLNQQQTEVFNLLSSGGGAEGYLVDFNGNISLPVIGEVPAAGLTKTALNKELVAKLEPFVKNPVVNIRFTNFKVTVLGEVNARGPQVFPNERATIVEAIAQAGGLTDLGKRTNIMVFREHPDGRHTCDTLDINDARIFGEKAYQLQQNDLVYVSPNPIKLKRINANPTIYRDIPFIISMFSTFLLLLNLIIK